MKKILENMKKSQKGAVSLLVAFTLLMFVVILMGTYVLVSVNARSQLKSDQKIQDIYGEDVEKIDDMYEAVVNGWDIIKMVNAPKLLDGMTPIKFISPTETKLGRAVETNKIDNEWYDYKNKQWANAETKDDSMWVWIPRFAYKIDEESEKIEVVFLIGKTDYYYDSKGAKHKAQRATLANQAIDTIADYTVHPAFTDESSIDYSNGGWDEELTGIWVAKFEAGYASGNNDSKQVDSTVTYSNTTTNYYGECTTSTKIKYPVFRPTTYSMNYINIQDAYKISKALTGESNIYGLNKTKTNADSHLMKNSEWGAVAYLSKSIYGNDNEVVANDATLNNGVNTIYAISGCTSKPTTNGQKIVTQEEIIKVINGEATDANGVYLWNQQNGQSASTTGNIYGIYDMSGGTEERVAAYINNGNSNLDTNGQALKNEKSTKYVTIYANSYTTNKTLGDGINETSTGIGSTSGWNFNDLSEYPTGNTLFFARGGNINNNLTDRGIFAFTKTNGGINEYGGFRAVLVEK